MPTHTSHPLQCAIVGYGYWGQRVLKTLLSHDSSTTLSTHAKNTKNTKNTKNANNTARTPIFAPYTQTPLSQAHCQVIGLYDRAQDSLQRAIKDYTSLVESNTPHARRDAATQDSAQADFASADFIARDSTNLDSISLDSTLDSTRQDSLLPKIPKIYASFDELCADERVEAVFIITPPSTHFSLALQAINAKKHIFVEKPLALSHAQCTLLYEKARALGVIIHCDHIFLYAPAVQWLRTHKQTLGEILSLHARRTNLGIFQSGVDVVWDLALHDIAICDYVFNELPQSAHAQIRTFQGYRAIGDVYMDFDFMAHIHTSWASPIKTREMTIIGSKRSIIYDEMRDEKLCVYDCDMDFALESSSHAISRTNVCANSQSTIPQSATTLSFHTMSALSASIADFVLQIRDQAMREELVKHTLRVISVLESLSMGDIKTKHAKNVR